MHSRLLAIVSLVFVSSASVGRAQPVASRLVLPMEMGRTGVFRIPAGASELQVQAQLLDNGGNTVRPSGCAATWTTGDPSILSLLRPSPTEAWVKPAREGITQLTATFSCAPALTASIPVIVGSAGIANPIAPTVEGAAFYPATLKVTPPGWAYVSGGTLFIRPIDTGVQLVASVRSLSDALITPAEFPMKWSVSNPGVLAIDTAYDHTAFVNPAGTGTTTVTFTVEGMSQSFDVTVQDARPATSDDHATLAARTMKIAASSVAGGGTTALPITVRPAPVPVTGGTPALPITVRPAPGSVSPMPAQTTPIVATTTRQPVAIGSAGRTGTAAPADTTPPTATSAPMGPVAATAEPLIVSARNFRAIAGNEYVELLWDATPGAVGYGLTRADANTPRAMLLTPTGDSVRTALRYIDGGVTAGVTYGYRLRTYFRNSAGALVADPDTSAGALATPKAGSAGVNSQTHLTNVSVKLVETLGSTGYTPATTVNIAFDWYAGAKAYEVSWYWSPQGIQYRSTAVNSISIPFTSTLGTNQPFVLCLRGLDRQPVYPYQPLQILPNGTGTTRITISRTFSHLPATVSLYDVPWYDHGKQMPC